MYIFTNENDVIFHISETLDYQSNGNYLVDNGKLAIPPVLVKEMFEINEIPAEVEAYKYCYTKEKGFYENEKYSKVVKNLQD